MPESKTIVKKISMKERMAKYVDNVVKAEDKENVEDLPRWVKTTLVIRAIEDLSYEEAAKRIGRNKTTLSRYGRSPAAKKWLAEVFEIIDNPVEMAKAYLRGMALSITVDRVVCLDAALEAGDYRVADSIAKDIQEKLGIVSPKTKSEAPAVLNITIGAGTEVPTIEATWVEVKDDEE